jgi:RimJ/RimL family protein N-acetyltransferase
MTSDAPFIRGEKVWLRAYRKEDLAAYERFVTSRDAQWAGYSAPYSRDGIADWYEKSIRARHGTDAYYFVVSPLGSDEFIGTTWLWNYDSRLSGPEFSIFMTAAQWGTGVGTDAVNATLDLAYGFTDADRIWLVTLVRNERAQRSFEKAGFSREGVVRKYHMYRGGFEDGVLMSILRADWEALERPRSWDFDSSD